LEDLEDLRQGCPGFDGGPSMELAQAGIGFHRLDHQEQQLFLPACEGPGRVAFTQPITHFVLNRLLDVLADDSCPGYFRYHRVPPSMLSSRTYAQSVSSGATASAQGAALGATVSAQGAALPPVCVENHATIPSTTVVL